QRSLRPRMVGAVHRPQIVAVDPRIELGRAQVGVAEHLLYGPQVGPALQEVGGESMTEGGRAHALGDPGGLRGALDDPPHSPARKWRAPRVEKQPPLSLAALEFGPYFARVQR